jgi:excinuclease ABC subunit C
MKFVRKIFPYRDKCKLGEKRGCFNYQIGLCPGTCIGAISKKDYDKNLKNIEKILSGNINRLLKDLEKEMKILANHQNFEEAVKMRNKIGAFQYLKDINFIKNNGFESNETQNLRIESYDISHISGKNRVGVMVVFQDGEFLKSEYKKFKVKEGINDDLAGLTEVLERRLAHREWQYPDIILIDGGKTHLEFIYKKLQNILSSEELSKIKLFSVVKDVRHKAKEVLSLRAVDKLKNNEVLILVNEETHRFAINYHKLLRNKIK